MKYGLISIGITTLFIFLIFASISNLNTVESSYGLLMSETYDQEKKYNFTYSIKPNKQTTYYDDNNEYFTKLIKESLEEWSKENPNITWEEKKYNDEDELQVNFTIQFVKYIWGDEIGDFSCMFYEDNINKYADVCKIRISTNVMDCKNQDQKYTDNTIKESIMHEVGHFLLTLNVGHNNNDENHLMYAEKLDDERFTDRGLAIPTKITKYDEIEHAIKIKEEIVQIDSEITELNKMYDELEKEFKKLELIHQERKREYSNYTDSKIIYANSIEEKELDKLYDGYVRAINNINSVIDKQNVLTERINQETNKQNILIDELNCTNN